MEINEGIVGEGEERRRFGRERKEELNKWRERGREGRN